MVKFYHLGCDDMSVFISSMTFSHDLGPQVSTLQGLRILLSPLIPGPLNRLPVLLSRAPSISQGPGKLALQPGCGQTLKSALGCGGPPLRLRGTALPCWAGPTSGKLYKERCWSSTW